MIFPGGKVALVHCIRCYAVLDFDGDDDDDARTDALWMRTSVRVFREKPYPVVPQVRLLSLGL